MQPGLRTGHLRNLLPVFWSEPWSILITTGCATKIRRFQMDWAGGPVAFSGCSQLSHTHSSDAEPWKRVDRTKGGKNNKREDYLWSCSFCTRNPIKEPLKRCGFNIILHKDLKRLWKMKWFQGTAPLSVSIKDLILKTDSNVTWTSHLSIMFLIASLQ